MISGKKENTHICNVSVFTLKAIWGRGPFGDGVTLNTSAIQNAIDDCNKNGGGQVYVPPGTFKSGTIWLKSNVELHISRGGVLLASDKLDDYNDLDAYDRYEHLEDKYLDMRGHHVFSVKGAKKSCA